MENQLRKRVHELLLVNEKLVAQNEEKDKQMAELLAAQEKAEKKAEESEKLKTSFLLNISHEIRTPLNIIIGFSEFLAEENVSSSKRAEYLYLIHTNSIRLLNLLDNILDISKIETGQKMVSFNSFSINKLIDKLLNKNKRAAKKKQLKIHVHKELENELDLIYSSEHVIYQIFNNLINNAIKYTHAGRIDFGYKMLDWTIELFVSDTGIGISEEYKPLLFSKFSQENSSLSRSFEGAGLGLPIVKGIVDLMKGTISVNSEKDKGTTFCITLPLQQNRDEYPTRENNTLALKTIENKEITLLVVEDDEATFYLLNMQIMQEFDCKIIHAIDGKTALEKVKEHPEITCVLMDMHLPGIDGCETTKRIKRLKKDMPVFAVTAAVMDFDKERALDSGCDDFFSKPVDRDRLYRLIEKCGSL